MYKASSSSSDMNYTAGVRFGCAMMGHSSGLAKEGQLLFEIKMVNGMLHHSLGGEVIFIFLRSLFCPT